MYIKIPTFLCTLLSAPCGKVDRQCPGRAGAPYLPRRTIKIQILECLHLTIPTAQMRDIARSNLMLKQSKLTYQCNATGIGCAT